MIAIIFFLFLSLSSSSLAGGSSLVHSKDQLRRSTFERLSNNDFFRHLDTTNDNGNDAFTVVTVFFSQQDLDNTTLRFDEGTSAGSRQGGVFPFYDNVTMPTNQQQPIGDYSFLITFLTPSGTGCIANGAYTFLTSVDAFEEEEQQQQEEPGGLTILDQITFTASCSGLPHFSITGGNGKYVGASGFVKFMIPTDGGFLHEINISNERQQETEPSSSSSSPSSLPPPSPFLLLLLLLLLCIHGFLC